MQWKARLLRYILDFLFRYVLSILRGLLRRVIDRMHFYVLKKLVLIFFASDEYLSLKHLACARPYYSIEA